MALSVANLIFGILLLFLQTDSTKGQSTDSPKVICGQLELEGPTHFQSNDIREGITMFILLSEGTFDVNYIKKDISISSNVPTKKSPRGINWAWKKVEDFGKVEIISNKKLKITFISTAYHARWDEYVEIKASPTGFSCETVMIEKTGFTISAGFLIDQSAFHLNSAMVAGVATIAGGLIGSSAPSGGNIGTLGLLLGMRCSIDNEIEKDTKLMWEIHPLGIGIGSHSGRFIFGSIVSNVCLIICFAFILLFIGFSGSILCDGRDFNESSGSVRSPGLSILAFTFLYPGLTLASARVAYYPSSVDGIQVILCIAVLLLCLLAPLIIYFSIIKKIGSNTTCVDMEKVFKWLPEKSVTNTLKHQKKMQQLKTKRSRQKFYISDYPWVDISTTSFLQRNGAIFQCYRFQRRWFILIEILPSLALPMICAWHTTEYSLCVVRNWLVAGILLFDMCGKVFLRPDSSKFLGILGTIISVLRFFGSFMMAIGFMFSVEGESEEINSSASGTCFSVASGLILFSTFTIILKGAAEIVIVIADKCLSHSELARQYYRDDTEKDHYEDEIKTELESVEIDEDEDSLPLIKLDRGVNCLKEQLTPMSESDSASYVTQQSRRPSLSRDSFIQTDFVGSQNFACCSIERLPSVRWSDVSSPPLSIASPGSSSRSRLGTRRPQRTKRRDSDTSTIQLCEI